MEEKKEERVRKGREESEWKTRRDGVKSGGREKGREICWPEECH